LGISLYIFREKAGSGLEMTHFFNNKQVLMENVSFQDLTPNLLAIFVLWYEDTDLLLLFIAAPNSDNTLCHK
jgi:hypothetical protein